MSPSDLEKLPKPLEIKFSDLEMRIMEDIVRRIKINSEVTRSADWQLNRLKELGQSNRFIRDTLKMLLSGTDLGVSRLFKDAAEQEYTDNKELYMATNNKFTAYKDNAVLQQFVLATAEQTQNEFNNITQSLGFVMQRGAGTKSISLTDFYQQTLDNAILDITSGAFDYNTVIKRTISEMTNSGLRTIDYATGHSNRINVAVRRAIVTGVNQVVAKINDDVAEDLDADRFEVSWHATARPTHQLWQGRDYNRAELISICGLGTVEGLCGANCRHSYRVFIPGISKRTYTDEQLAEMNAKENELKEYKGKQYTSYEATQQQRKMETLMRKQRQDIKLLEEAGVNENDIIAAKSRYRSTMAQYVNFSKNMELPQQRQRIYVDGLGNVTRKTK